VISIDTLRADRLPAYGYTAGRTPAIDALVADGVLFERAYTHSPLTLPAHVSILSGQLPQQHGVRDNVGFRVPPELTLMPRRLKEHGFATAGVVSSAVLREDTGIGAGFDFYDGRMPPVRGGAALDEAQREGLASLAIAQQWIARQAGPTWFLLLHLYEPHAPYRPSERYRHMDPYDGEIAQADDIVGTLLRDLRARGMYDAATIVLLSDHGEGLGDHGEQEHGLFLYEEAVRVPLVVKLPGQSGGGTRVAELVQHIDLLPTLLDVAGAPLPSPLPGRSLRPLLEERRSNWPDRRVYSEALFGRYHFGWNELFALTDARFRFIQAPRPELYDLVGDPREQHNLAESRPQVVNALSRELAEVMSSDPIERPAALPPDVRQRLASLGYVGLPIDDNPAALGGLRADPKDKVHVLAQYRAALKDVAGGDLGGAVARLRQIAAEEPAMADLWQTIGRYLARLGRSDEAVAAYEEHLRRKPTSVSGLLELSSLLLVQGRLTEATEQAELAVAVGGSQPPTDAVAAYEMLAKIALARKDSDQARRYAREAEHLDTGSPLTDFVEGRLAYDAGRFDQARAFFDRAVTASAARTVPLRGLYLYQGDCLAHVQRFDEAERAFRREIELFPDSLWAYLSLANLHQAFGRFTEADQVLDVLLRTVPSAQARTEAAKLRAARVGTGERR
jgi:tetratricopeptide (TPR) repeat protein